MGEEEEEDDKSLTETSEECHCKCLRDQSEAKTQQKLKCLPSSLYFSKHSLSKAERASSVKLRAEMGERKGRKRRRGRWNVPRIVVLVVVL